MSVYVDNAFVEGDWGKWTGGGHLQADTTEELHEFAAKLGLKRSWFQTKPGLPEYDHYDLVRSKRQLALELGAIDDEWRGAARRTLARQARRKAQEGGAA